MNMPATAGAAQWILGINPVQANLKAGKIVSFIVPHDVKLVDHPPKNANCNYGGPKKSRDQTPFGDRHVLVFYQLLDVTRLL